MMKERAFVRLLPAPVAAALLISSLAHAGSLEVETSLPDEERVAIRQHLIASVIDALPAPHVPAALRREIVIPYIGSEVLTVDVFDPASQGMVTKNWAALTRDQFLQQLSSQYSETQVYKWDASGGLTLAGIATAGANAGKGRYQLVFNNFRYKTYPCSKADPDAGELLVGVGLRLEVDAEFKSGSFNVGFGPLALAASKNKIAGIIRAHVKGLANSITLSNKASELASANVSYDSLIQASNLNAIAAQALESIMSPMTPFVMGYKDGRGEGSCLVALAASSS